MNRRILKAQISDILGNGKKVSMVVPEGSDLLNTQLQEGMITLWFATPLDRRDPEEIKFEMYHTGRDIESMDERLRYINTFQMEGGVVYHLFRNFS